MGGSNPGLQPSVKGYALDHSLGGLHQELWEGFLKYDSGIAEGGKQALNLALGHGWASRLVAAVPGPASLAQSIVPLTLTSKVSYHTSRSMSGTSELL